jgi:hypothetical protein
MRAQIPYTIAITVLEDAMYSGSAARVVAAVGLRLPECDKCNAAAERRGPLVHEGRPGSCEIVAP